MAAKSPGVVHAVAYYRMSNDARRSGLAAWRPQAAA
jgi:hypothetical protein